jgi:hypothetical protein
MRIAVFVEAQFTVMLRFVSTTLRRSHMNRRRPLAQRPNDTQASVSVPLACMPWLARMSHDAQAIQALDTPWLCCACCARAGQQRKHAHADMGKRRLAATATESPSSRRRAGGAGAL